MDNAWKSLFPTIGNLGLPLFAGGKVTLLSENDGTVHAHVDGFQVEILLDGDCTPVQMCCSCPRTHELCPHMAAVLYALEEPADSWSNVLERLMSQYDAPGFCDPLDGFELAEDIKAAVIHLLRKPETNEWKAICKLYFFVFERCNSQRCIDMSLRALVGFAEKALCITFQQLSAQQQAQMRTWLQDADGSWYSHKAPHIIGLLVRNATPKSQKEMDQWIQSLLN